MYSQLGLPAVPSISIQAVNEPKRTSLLGIRSSCYAKAPLRRFGGPFRSSVFADAGGNLRQSEAVRREDNHAFSIRQASSARL
jgi:hypothetical protein